MKVLTLDQDKFADACRRLELAACDGGFRPDAVVGIESGGRYVAEQMLKGVPHEYVTLRRPSTAAKKGFVKKTLARMPRWLCDALRVAEARVLALRKPSAPCFEGSVPASLSRCGHILIVDDAVDSGATMQAVRDAVREACPDASVRTAAITVTTRNPLIRPDACIYNRLIRFPWSIDAHN